MASTTSGLQQSASPAATAAAASAASIPVTASASPASGGSKALPPPPPPQSSGSIAPPPAMPMLSVSAVNSHSHGMHSHQSQYHNHSHMHVNSHSDKHAHQANGKLGASSNGMQLGPSGPQDRFLPQAPATHQAGRAPGTPGIKVKIKRTSSTDSRSSGGGSGGAAHANSTGNHGLSMGSKSGDPNGGSKEILHEIVRDPAASAMMANGSSKKSNSSAGTNSASKKDKLKLNVVGNSGNSTAASAENSNVNLLSDHHHHPHNHPHSLHPHHPMNSNSKSVSSSLDSPMSMNTVGLSGSSGSSTSSSPVVGLEPTFPKFGPSSGPGDQPAPGGVLKRHLLGQTVEPPSKKSKVTEDQNNSSSKFSPAALNGVLNCKSANSKAASSNKKGGKGGGDSREGVSCEASTMTDPELLGPCQPGTAVKLQGAVLQECHGVLEINVTWRGKSFMGTMIDFTRVSEDHKWSGPKDPSMHKRKRGRGGRSRTPPVKIPISKKMKQNKEGGVNPVKNGGSGGTQTNPASPQGISGNKGGGGLVIDVGGIGDLNSPARASRLVPRVNYDESEDNDDEFLKGFSDKNGAGRPDRTPVKLDGLVLTKSPTSNYIECPKAGCSKKFPILEALKYHITALHREEDPAVAKAKAAAVAAAAAEAAQKVKKARECVNAEVAASASPKKLVKVEVKMECKAEPKEEPKQTVKDEVKAELKVEPKLESQPAVPPPSPQKPAPLMPATTPTAPAEEKPTDLSTIVNGHEGRAPPPPSARPPPPPPTTTAMKPSPNIQGVSYLSSPVSSPVPPPGPPKAHQMTHHVPPPLMHNGFLNKPPEGGGSGRGAAASPLALNNKLAGLQLPSPQLAKGTAAPPAAAASKTTGPASPAYSDISDEETPAVPPTVLPPQVASQGVPPPQPPQVPPPTVPAPMAAAASMASLLGLGVSPGVIRPSVSSSPSPLSQPKPLFNSSPQQQPRPQLGQPQHAAAKERKTDGSAPTTQTLGPPPSHLPPELHGGSLMGMLGPPGSGSSALLNQAYMSAMMQAAMASSGQRMPGFPPPPTTGAPGPAAKGALDVMAQHANNFLASSKLQELQEKVTSKKPPTAVPSPQASPAAQAAAVAAMRAASSPSPSLSMPSHAQAAASMAAAANMASLLGLSVPPGPHSSGPRPGHPPTSSAPPAAAPRSSPSPMMRSSPSPMMRGHADQHGGAAHLHLGYPGGNGGKGGAPTDLSLPQSVSSQQQQAQQSTMNAAAAAALLSAVSSGPGVRPPPPPAAHGGAAPSHASLLQGLFPPPGFPHGLRLPSGFPPK